MRFIEIEKTISCLSIIRLCYCDWLMVYNLYKSFISMVFSVLFMLLYCIEMQHIEYVYYPLMGKL